MLVVQIVDAYWPRTVCAQAAESFFRQVKEGTVSATLNTDQKKLRASQTPLPPCYAPQATSTLTQQANFHYNPNQKAKR